MSDNILKSTRVEQNEIIKAEDVNSGYGFAIKNVLIAMKSMLDAESNFVVGGLVKKGTAYNLTIEPVFGINKDDGGFNPVVDTNENIDKISINPSSDQQRIDTVMIRGVNKSSNLQQRAFIDFDSGTKTIQDFETENELILEYKVISGIPGVAIAPARENGWIKVAEVIVPATATGIEDCTVNSITADIPGMENLAWTNEKTATYNLKTLADLRTIFRKNHNADGSHKVGSIGVNELNLTNSGKVTGANIQNGGSDTINATTYGSTDSIANVLKSLAQAVTSLYNDYQVNGKYGLKGEVVISKDSAFDPLTAIKIKSNGDSTATISIGSDVVLTLKKNIITVNSSYAPGTNQNALATMKQVNEVNTKATTNATNITQLQEDVSQLQNSSAVNDVLYKFSFGDVVYLATTENIDLNGVSKTIDGISLLSSDTGKKVLVKNQDDATENGIYQIESGAWTRTDSSEILLNKFFTPTAGQTNKGKLFYTPASVITIGTTELEFVESMFAREPISNKIVSYDENGNIIGNTIKATTELIIPTSAPVNPSNGSIYIV